MKLKLTSLIILACALVMTGCTKTTTDNSSLLALLGGSNGPVLSAWTRLLGHSGNNTIGYAITVDTDGNSYATGYTTGILDTNRTGGVQEDVFVARYDKDGARQWVRQMGVEALITEGRGIAVDSDGNSYTAGLTQANLEAGSGNSTGTRDVFVAKYDTNGTRLWVKQLGAAAKYTLGLAVAVDSSGNSYVTGYTNADLDGAGPGVLTGTYDIFIVKYDTNGVLQWVKQLGVAGTENIGNGIAVDQEGNCYVTGNAKGDLDGAGAGSLTGTTDVFIAKYNTSGTLQWVIQKGVNTKETYGWGIDVDANGNSYVTGTTYGDLDGAGSGSLIGSCDVFVMKYNTSGEMQWLKQTSAAGCWADGKGIAIDSTGNCYATGSTNADLDGAGPGVFTGDVNIFVIAYDKNGTSLWSRQMASDIDSDDMNAYGIAATTNGTCIVAGYVDEDFDGQELTGLWSDAFVTTRLNE